MANQPIYHPSDTIYRYDGSFEGFLSCVFYSFQKHECPFAIWDNNTDATSLFPMLEIPTEQAHADRVFWGIGKKINRRTQQLVMTSFLSGDPNKELLLLRFLQVGFALGGKIIAMLGHPDVAPVLALERYVQHEAHQFKGFLRFEESEGMLGAVIAPKSYVLPLLRGHFCSRFPEENFLIYDETHCAVLLYQNHHATITQLSAPLTLPTPDGKESYYQALWKQFYNTIEIKERHNEACRRNHCPKRYWANMTELKDL